MVTSALWHFSVHGAALCSYAPFARCLLLGWGLGSIVSAPSHLVGAFQAAPGASTADPARRDPEFGASAPSTAPEPADGFVRFLDRGR